MNRIRRGAWVFFGICVLGVSLARAQQSEPPAKTVQKAFDYVNHKVLEMAKDFPDNKYDYRPTKEMRSFGAVLIHIASGNVYAARKGRGEDAKWTEMDPKNFRTKAAVVAALEKSITDATTTLNAVPAAQFTKTLEPWMSVIEHSAEHYGLLVAYYRTSGLVPPDSRPKSK